MSDLNRSDIPQVLPWDKRFKGVLPLPGGYDGYLTSLKDVCHYIRDDRPRRDELHGWLEKRFSLTSKSAYRLGLATTSACSRRAAGPTLPRSIRGSRRQSGYAI